MGVMMMDLIMTHSSDPKQGSGQIPIEPNVGSKSNLGNSKLEAYFDNKLRPDIVPEWDGDPDTLAQWMLKVNHIATRSSTVSKQLGEIIPLRLYKSAKRWFYSLPSAYQKEATHSWSTIRDLIGGYYMNRAWLDRQKSRAYQASFRQFGYSDETPSEYFVRKAELLRMLDPISDSQLIMEVMNGAPDYWHAIIDDQRCATAVEFQAAIKFHETSLSNSPFQGGTDVERCIRNLEASLRSQATTRI